MVDNTSPTRRFVDIGFRLSRRHQLSGNVAVLLNGSIMRRCLLLLPVLTCLARAHAAPMDQRLTAINNIVKQIHTSYIDPDKAKKLEPVLLRTDFSGAMDDEAFAKRVTEVMHTITQDPHLRLFYREEGTSGRVSGGPTPADITRRQAELREQNYGIDRVERLPGNIGYLKTRFFAPAAGAAAAIGAAMTLLSNTDALIIDLRENGGGSADGVPLLASYFFDEATHLADIYRREGNVTKQQWTSPAVAGTRFGAEKPVYILTSTKTFSAAEGLAFALKNLKRAVIVGETTRGGAHPSRMETVDAHFELMLPTSTARDPVTLKDWEGVGVTPDVAVRAAEALVRAQILLLNKLQPNKQGAESQTEIRKRLVELGASF